MTATKQSAAARRGRLFGSASAVAIGTGVANVLGYGLTVIGARLLGPGEFGAFSALLALVIVGNVVALAVQATTARAVVRDGTTSTAVWSGLKLAVLVTVVLLAASPLLAAVMTLPTVASAASAAIAVGALTATAPALGLVQGAERFRLLAVMIAAQAALRVGGGIVGVLVGRTSATAMAGIAVGFVMAAILFWVVAHPPIRGRRTKDPQSGLTATVVNGSMLLGFVVLTNVDVMLARHVLSEYDSGLYAAGAIFTKIAFWLPQFVPLLAFPALADPARRRTAINLGVAAVAGSGLVLATASWLLAGPAVSVMVGDDYAELTPWVPAFAGLGAVYALAYLLVYARLAHGDTWTISVVWAVLIAYIGWVELIASTVLQVVLPGLVAATVIVAWGLVRERTARIPAVAT